MTEQLADCRTIEIAIPRYDSEVLQAQQHNPTLRLWRAEDKKVLAGM